MAHRDRRYSVVAPPSNDITKQEAELVEALRHVQPTPVDPPPAADDFAPPVDRVVSTLQNSSDAIKDRVAQIVEDVTMATVGQINQMRAQLDAFETVVLEAAAASKASLEKHIGIAAGTIASIEQMKKQVAEYRQQVTETIPTNGAQA